MQRIIHINVTANRARVSASSLGTQGEVAVTTLFLTFDASWDGLTKRLLWRTADGEKSAFSLISTDADGRCFAPVPALPLSIAGRCSLTVEGFEVNGTELERCARSVQLFFSVEPNDSSADIEAEKLDATLGMQLQAEIDSLEGELRDEFIEQVDLLSEALDGKADKTHGHNASSIVCYGADGMPNLLQGAINEIGEALKEKADVSHSHTFSAADVSYNGEGSVYDALTSLSERSEVKALNFAFSADNWTGDVAPFSRELSIPSAKASSLALLTPAPGASDTAFAQFEASRLRAIPKNGAVTVKAYGTKPSVSIPVSLLLIL